ncbi:MAG: RNA polymerase sigma-54 factor, partial [Acidobacteria bacterium]|nr:RNA polymerase sigma-54 factor [Acidobacteriota bacterium]NIQ87322.1 RNA polymerase sigma-54 factor [Acidobacteriota bacterium]NIT12534.1 RNA polymerase sigma-54 factor [Acidobacteriota bacterium]
MALEQKLGLRMSQRLVMTPSLQQAIKLLQMSKLELVEEVQQELLENPTLEEAQVENPPAEQSAEQSDPPEKEAAEDGTTDDAFSEIDYESYFQDVDSDFGPPRGSGEVPSELPTFENTLADSPNLTDHLTWQLEMNVSDERVKEIGRAVIGNLDNDGYLKATTEELQSIGG